MYKKGFFIIFFISFFSFSQNRELDSLYANLEKFEEDTNKVNTYNQLSFKLNNSKLEMSLFFAGKAKELSLDLDYTNGLVSAYSNIGIAYYFKGEYSIALKNHTKAAEILEKVKNYKRLSAVYNNIALIYLDLSEYRSAENYFLKSLKLDKKRNDFVGIADSYNNIGSIYKDKKEYKKALEYFNQSLHYREVAKDTLGLPSTLTNLGSVNIVLGNYEMANQQLFTALESYIKNDDNFGKSLIYNCLGDLKTAQKQYSIAIEYYNKSLLISKKNNIQSYISYSYEWIANAYEKLYDYKNALVFHRKHVRISDHIYNSENSALLAEIQTKYETEKHKKQIILSKALLAKQNTVTNIFIAGFLVMIVLVVFILRSYKTKIRNNKIILDQKFAIEEKNKLVEIQHKDIKDSIKYAERIQGAILPPQHLWKSILPNSFVFYQPKDILSGDFYWIAETEEYKFIAAADCTGHGVPGALISIVNYNLLNKAVLEKNITDPGRILDAVNIWLTESLHQTSENSTVKDGMDISLISIKKQTGEIAFSGANNPLFVYSGNQITEYKGDKFPVGSFIEDQTMTFSTTKINTKKGDLLYLFSDGYADQFGGEKGKKFKMKNLRDEFKVVQNVPIKNQKEHLENRFFEWKGELEQVDDVMIIGIEV
jgi:serine phosphatase RsbU (regulator of sigma subunit)/Tfp pilus assembly protein PilF